jgi:hypothetical protein
MANDLGFGYDGSRAGVTIGRVNGANITVLDQGPDPQKYVVLSQLRAIGGQLDSYGIQPHEVLNALGKDMSNWSAFGWQLEILEALNRFLPAPVVLGLIGIGAVATVDDAIRRGGDLAAWTKTKLGPIAAVVGGLGAAVDAVKNIDAAAVKVALASVIPAGVGAVFASGAAAIASAAGTTNAATTYTASAPSVSPTIYNSVATTAPVAPPTVAAASKPSSIESIGSIAKAVSDVLGVFTDAEPGAADDDRAALASLVAERMGYSPNSREHAKFVRDFLSA